MTTWNFIKSMAPSLLWPYVLATLFATWKLGGVFAPFDYHVPWDVLERMLHNIAPTYLCLETLDQICNLLYLSFYSNIINIVKTNLPFRVSRWNGCWSSPIRFRQGHPSLILNTTMSKEFFVLISRPYILVQHQTLLWSSHRQNWRIELVLFEEKLADLC
jgi:hypothetical protein